MRFKRVATAPDMIPVLLLQHGERWVPVSAVLAAAGGNKGGAADASDLIALLGDWGRNRGRLEQGLLKIGPDDAASEVAGSPLLPFEPRSYRDFMLYERHVIDAGRGYARRFLPGAYRIASIYESFRRRPFPAFRPHPLWYRQPIYYMGNHLAFVTDGAEIRCPAYSKALDYELELGFVLAEPLLNASPEEALAAIGGFTVFNDFSARDVQLAEMRSGFGPQKAKHFRNAMSSELVTADEILPLLDKLTAQVRINGRCVCATGTRGMRHSLGAALAHVSRDERLFPGEFFGSGTLPGGSGMENGVWLQPGDTIELTIERVGMLRNVIAARLPNDANPDHQGLP
jgi:2-keto-4-pentenoate hydratase/2-oxohepta-3-ene-1,7-dioic acid hydratase in catechol pathway